MSEVTDRDVQEAAEALRHRLDLLNQLDQALPEAESGDPEAMLRVADLYVETARPQMADEWRQRARVKQPGKVRRGGRATSTS